jgi:hypothetical protein
MNKKEKGIILDTYRRVKEINLHTGIDKDDSIRDIGMMLIKLNLSDDKKQIDNEIYYKKNNFSFMQKEGYNRLCEIAKIYIGYLPLAEDVEELIYHLEYNFTEEHKKNILACMKMIEEV